MDNAVDPDLYDVDPQPETDQEEVKMNTTLYFFSDADAATDSCSLKDNFVSRFASAQKWDGVSIPSQGDCLLFNVDEASSIVGNAAGLDALKKMHEAGVLLVMEGGFRKAISKRSGRMVENYNPYAVGDAEEEPNGGELPLWIWTAPLPGAASLAMLLEPTDTDGDFTDDFSQGELCDMALTEIKDALAAVNGTAGMSVANGTKSGDEQKELTQLMNATKFIFTNPRRSSRATTGVRKKDRIRITTRWSSTCGMHSAKTNSVITIISTRRFPARLKIRTWEL